VVPTGIVFPTGSHFLLDVWFAVADRTLAGGSRVGVGNIGVQQWAQVEKRGRPLSVIDQPPRGRPYTPTPAAVVSGEA